MAAVPLPVIRPMLATLGDLPVPPGWGYELKWDGVRAVVYLDGGGIRAVSRNDRQVEDSYPELGGLPERLAGRRMILDGEIVALDRHGRPSFSLLQQRMHVRTPSPELLQRVPVRFYAFDVLHLDGRSTVDLPYTQRRGMVQDVDFDNEVAETPPFWADDAGKDLMTTAAERGLEGVVAKRLDSPYQPGARSRLWIKAPLNTTVEVVVAGWKPGGGRRAGMIGSLLLGMYDDAGRLTYVGHVGTGFTQQALHELGRQLAPLARPTAPFDLPVPREHSRDAHWVEPVLVGEVAYRTRTLNRTGESRLRHPSWRGLRPDKDPRQATIEPPVDRH